MKQYQTSRLSILDADARPFLRRRARQISGPKKYYGIVYALPAAVLLIGGFIAERLVTMGSGPMGYIFVLWALIASIVSAIYYHRRVMWEVELACPLAQDEFELTVTDVGLEFTHSGTELIVRWGYIADVIETDKALLILMTNFNYMPIGVAQFAGGKAEISEFASLLRARNEINV
ncbi:MAG: YcxB family protein [Pseudomonadota bacterium]